ncbi:MULTISPECIES: hypothetical protein [unclassified Janthinobacterium]|uniref:hypothetical protein n=1 Tax=unclassified Janthinobacterium TaxID=2610881 RepID=UPI00160BF555|nr:MULTISPECIES: hypothetical protein [unclassified Janthinobacterium]MBB5608089.1 hypothetical protein [Janthinobacterium sp. S3T4]MBB5613415.1 hypothetical protein [Janthinobacterium sp. S3M3]
MSGAFAQGLIAFIVNVSLPALTPKVVMVIQGGSGFFVRDEQGNRYLGGGVWCMTEHMLEGVDLAPIFGANAGVDEESNVRQENQCPVMRLTLRVSFTE